MSEFVTSSEQSSVVTRTQHTRVVHKTQLVNVSVTKTTMASGGQSLHSPLGMEFRPQNVGITLISPSGQGQLSPNLLSIEPIELGTPFTAAQLDEKRENRRVYEYLCRLMEVRNWLVECLQTSDIPEEIQLEANLSNGVILARLGNYFAPDIVPRSKIFDFDESTYKKKGKVYRHTDNIMMWRNANRAVRLPEVLIPETTDIYSGRNINTIFCLYALAMHLFRLRRGPPIRNQAGNAQFPEAVMEEMQERLKGSDLPSFGDLGGMLSTSPSDKSAHSRAVYRINEAIDSGKIFDFLPSMQDPDAGILYVEEGLVDNYRALLKNKKSVDRQGDELTRDEIQTIITKVNNIDALRRLDVLFACGPAALNHTEMTQILDDLHQEGVMQHAIPVYGQVLYKTREAQQSPLTIDQVDDIVDAVNACVSVKLATVGGDAEGLYEVLTNSELHCEGILNKELKPVYLELLRNEYKHQDKNFILFPDRIQAIVRDAPLGVLQKQRAISIKEAASKGDEEALVTALQDVPQAKPEYVTYYLIVLQTVTYETIIEIEEIIITVNKYIIIAEHRAKNAVKFNRLMLEGKRNEAQKALMTGWANIVITDRADQYITRLDRELSTRIEQIETEQDGAHKGEAAMHKLGKDDELGYLPETFEAGVLYVNIADDSLQVHKPDKVNQWMLTSNDIEELIKKENELIETDKELHKEDDILAERKRKEEAATKIEQAWRQHRIRKDFDELKNSKEPSLRVVRRFIPTLVSSQEDIEEETEIEDDRSTVTKLINANRKMDDELKDLDGRIALLVKNRINLQELIEHGKKLKKEAGDSDSLLKAKAERGHEHDEWNAFEMICYHLQTEPQHLVRLINNYYATPEVLPDFIKRALLPLFNFAAEERESFLVASLIRALLKSDVDKLVQPENLRKSNAAMVTRILLPLLVDTGAMRQSVVDLCKQLRLKENQLEFFNLNVENVFEAYEQRRPKDTKEAVSNQKVARVLNESKAFLAKWGLKFSEVLFDKNRKLPNMVRYLVNSLYIDMKERFPRSSHADIIQGIGGWLYKSLWEHLMITEIKCDDGKPDDNLGQRKAISQFIEFGVVNFGYGEDRWYLASLNEAIANINGMAMHVLTPVIAEEGEIYHQHKYEDVLGNRKPILHILLPQLNVLHRYCKTNISEMIPNEKDSLRFLIEKTPLPSADQQLYITLLLHPIPITDESQVDPQEMFQRTKKYVTECLLCNCPGENVTILVENPTLEQEEHRYRELPRSEENQMNLSEKKARILRNLNDLEKDGLVNAITHYQAIVTAIAKDINREREYRAERRDQLEHLRERISKLEEKKKQYNEQLNAYQEYLEKCLDNISLTPKRPSIRGDSMKAGKILKERQSLDAIKKVKLSGSKLDKQGILLSVDDYKTFKEHAKLSLEFCTTELPGIITVTIIEPKKQSKICDIDFQELLRAGSKGEQSIKLDGRVNLHVQKLTDFLNKQFHSK